MNKIKRINSLQYLRGIAAFLVLITHVLQYLNIKPVGNYFLSGQYGVDVFFILSGFIIYYTTQVNANWKSFMIRRVFRIYPAYLFAFVCYLGYVFLFTEFQVKQPFVFLFQNTLLFPYSDSIGYQSLLVTPAWSTTYELYFYFIVGIGLLFGLRKHQLPLILLLLFTLGYFYKIFDLINIGFEKYIFSLVSSLHVLKISIGIGIAMMYQNHNFVNIDRRYKILFWSVTQFMFLGLLLVKYNVLLATMGAMLFFISWLIIEEEFVNFFGNNIISRLMIYIGDISFSIYLIHLLIIKVLIEQFNINSLSVLLIFTVSFSIMAAHVMYKYIELPWISKAKKITVK